MRRVYAGVWWCSLWTASAASAQRIDLDASVGYSSAAWRTTLASQWRLPVGPRLTLGTGVRLTHYQGERASFRNQGDISPTVPDQLSIDPAVWGLNLMVSAQARVLGRVAVGANIDLVGVAVGPTRQQGAVTIEPARGSLLRYGNRDRGSLNSEFFVAVAVDPRIEVRGGMSHYVVGYHAQGGSTSTRYLRFENVPFVGVRWYR